MDHLSYRKTTSEAYAAWVAYCKACPEDYHSVVSFVAGYNAATEKAEKLAREKRSQAALLGHCRKLVMKP